MLEAYFQELGKAALIPARVAEEMTSCYRVFAADGSYISELAGRIRYLADGRSDYPAVGDWVAIRPRAAEGRARIECILPRKTILARKAAGRAVDQQILATNLDTVFVVTSLNRDFNTNRIERYLSIIWDSGASPVVLLNKADLCDEPERYFQEAEGAALDVPVHILSAAEGIGLEALSQYVLRGRTAAFVGSSGVGKSTIINRLSGSVRQRVGSIRTDDDRGRHTTTSRQMLLLPDGGVVIDTPGMRELQLWDSEGGVSRVFSDVEELATECRFRDCTHQNEPGCNVKEAIEDGRLDSKRFENRQKLLAELRFQERKTDASAARAEKERWKKIHKAMRGKNRI